MWKPPVPKDFTSNGLTVSIPVPDGIADSEVQTVLDALLADKTRWSDVADALEDGRMEISSKVERKFNGRRLEAVPGTFKLEIMKECTHEW